MDMDMDMDMDLELGTENLPFDPTKYCPWYVASPGQQLEKKLLYAQQVADRFCLTTRDLEILHREMETKFYFRQINNSLLLALDPFVIIWNNSVCYMSYHNDIRFRDFISAAESWVSSGLPFDNSLVIQAALHLIYECVQDQIQKLKCVVEDCWCFSSPTLHDLRMYESFLSIMTKKVMVEIFETGCPGVAVFLEPKQLQECLKPWNSIPEQLESIRAMLNKKLRRKFATMVVVPGLLLMVYVILGIPLYRAFVYVLVVAGLLVWWFIFMGLFFSTSHHHGGLFSCI